MSSSWVEERQREEVIAERAGKNKWQIAALNNSADRQQNQQQTIGI